jgi:hypothetical protein
MLYFCMHCNHMTLTQNYFVLDSQPKVPRRMRDLPEAWIISVAIQVLLVFIIWILCYTAPHCAFSDKSFQGNRVLSF